ncbi:DUF1761 domain-containing protein [bacterium]|nr:DUF1761 domain-containing protein [bacterium]
MLPNILFIVIAALIPSVVGFIYYHPKVMGTAWMNVAGMTQEKINSGNPLKLMGIGIVMSMLLALGVYSMVIHQGHVMSLTLDLPELQSELLSKFEGKYRTFGHGVFHGVLGAFLVVVPVLATNALYEQKGFKYIAVNGVYWLITIGLMGGVLCAWA